MKKLTNTSLSDFDGDIEFCEMCGDIAGLQINGYVVCKPCSRNVKKLIKPIEEEEYEQ